jgi:hypothetical protein
MIFIIFDLNNVPAEEEHRLKALLKRKNIRYHEKLNDRHSSRVLYVKNKAQSVKAKRLIQDFEEEWREKARHHEVSSAPPRDKLVKILFFLITLVLAFFLANLIL